MSKKRYSKIKGKNYEAKIARILHNFLYENVKEYREIIDNVDNTVGIKRDATSGISLDSKGDIDLGIGKKYFPFSIECKKREDIEVKLKNIFDLDKQSVLKRIYEKEAKKKAKQVGLYPLLIFSKNYHKDFVFFDINEVDIINIDKFEKYLKIGNYILVTLDEFLGVVKDDLFGRDNSG